MLEAFGFQNAVSVSCVECSASAVGRSRNATAHRHTARTQWFENAATTQRAVRNAVYVIARRAQCNLASKVRIDTIIGDLYAGPIALKKVFMAEGSADLEQWQAEAEAFLRRRLAQHAANRGVAVAGAAVPARSTATSGSNGSGRYA